MTAEARAARAAYTREYRRRNPDRVKQWRVNYWENKAREAATETNTEDSTTEEGPTA